MLRAGWPQGVRSISLRNLLQKQTCRKALFTFPVIMLCCFILLGSPRYVLAEKKTDASSHVGGNGKGGDAIRKQISKTMDIQRKTQKRESG